MSSHYLDMVRRSQRPGGFQFTAKSLLALVAFVAMCASAAYWWGVQSQLSSNWIVAVAFTAILVLAPPALTTFVIPWSPGGMLLQKINARTWGYMVVISAALYLIYYSYEIQYSWWAAQPGVTSTGLVTQQVIVGIIGFIFIPALLWAPVSSEELMEQVRQAHLVKRYELQTQADIAILRATLLRAQDLTIRGLANLNYGEQQELSGIICGVVDGIDQTLREIGHSVKVVSGATIPFTALADNADIRSHLDYVAQSLTQRSALASDATVMERAQARMEPAVAVPPVVRPSASERASGITVSHAPTIVPHDATSCPTMPHDALYAVARRELGAIWTVRDLARVLRVEEPTARQYKQAWEQAGGVTSAGLPNGRYSFTESEA